MKRCTKCGEEKARSDFNARRASRDGLAYICRACQAIKAKRERAENLEKFRAKGRKYAALGREGAKRRMEEWLADPANQERKRQKDKEWRERNRERKAANDKRWAVENRDKRNAAVARYRERHPEIARIRDMAQKARERGVPKPNVETRDYMMILTSDPCSYCGGPMEHIDHIEPLARGGGGEWDNLTAACGSCNQSKNAKRLLAFLLEDRPGVEPGLSLAA